MESCATAEGPAEAPLKCSLSMQQCYNARNDRDTKMLRNDVEAVPDTKPPRAMPLLVFLLILAVVTLGVVAFIDL